MSNSSQCLQPSLARVCYSKKAGWTFDSEAEWGGIWKGPFGSQAVAMRSESKVPQKALLERVEQVHRLHSSSSLFIGAKDAVCVWTSAGILRICGYSNGKWIYGEFPHSDWRVAISTFPILDLASLSKISERPSSESVSCSHIDLGNGVKINLPPAWHWVEEKTGLPPSARFFSDMLFSKGIESGFSVKHISTQVKRRAIEIAGYSQFTNMVIETGKETVSEWDMYHRKDRPPSPDPIEAELRSKHTSKIPIKIGYSYHLKTGWLILSFPLKDPKETLAFEGLRKYIEAHLPK